MTRRVRITTLVENTAPGGLLRAEHGLSFWIEVGGRHILFDTGAGGVLLANAAELDVDLATTDAIVLSHGHYDHTGGLPAALRAAPQADVYVHPAAFEPKYARDDDGTSRRIGSPFRDEAQARAMAGSLIHTTGPTELGDGLRITGPVPRRTAFEDTGGPFYLDEACRRPDPLTDDQAVFFESLGGTVVVLGCAHSGVVNILRYVLELADGRHVHAVLGGMHLGSASPDRLDKTIDALRELAIDRLMPVHCTGKHAVERIGAELPRAAEVCHVGTRVEFEMA